MCIFQKCKCLYFYFKLYYGNNGYDIYDEKQTGVKHSMQEDCHKNMSNILIKENHKNSNIADFFLDFLEVLKINQSRGHIHDNEHNYQINKILSEDFEKICDVQTNQVMKINICKNHKSDLDNFKNYSIKVLKDKNVSLGMIVECSARTSPYENFEKCFGEVKHINYYKRTINIVDTLTRKVKNSIPFFTVKHVIQLQTVFMPKHMLQANEENVMLSNEEIELNGKL